MFLRKKKKKKTMVTSDTETFLKKEKKIGVIIIANAIKKKNRKRLTRIDEIIKFINEFFRLRFITFLLLVNLTSSYLSYLPDSTG